MSLFFKRLVVIVIFFGIFFGSIYFGYRKWIHFVQVRKAKKYFFSEDYQESLNCLKHLPEKKNIRTQKQLEVEYMRAVCFQRTGQSEKAYAQWKKIFENTKFPRHKDAAHYYAGLNLWEKENIEGAFEHFMVILERYPESDYVGDSLFYVASYHENKNDIFKARDLYEKIVEKYPDATNIEKVIDKLGDLNIKLLYSKTDTPLTEVYIVKPGDSIATIAKKFNTTVELIMKCNQMKTTRINPHDRIKVVTATFSIVIDKSQNILILKADGKFFKRYRVGTGKEGSTPIGNFEITEKLINPMWFKPDGGVIPFGSKENLLGTRWMSIDSPGYGIHGTWEPDSVGKQSSMGCIRLINEEVEELYDLVPVATKVTIVD
ncbi:MAG: L,D-transpeptidase family protein [Candidatus Aureabacteria bacterium]|nr:L,D-transpeptidase family protein [Candidatus Auribacterota bacterium]